MANSAIVRGTEASLVFDPNCFRFGRALRAAFEAGGGPPAREVVYSHAHDDHTMGAELFSPPARVHARRAARHRLERGVSEGLVPGSQYEVGYPGAADEGRGVRVVLPDVLVDVPASLDLGEVLVCLRPVGPAHTNGDLWVFVEPDGVALCGDLWYAQCEPYVGSGSVRGLLEAIGQIREAKARVHVPGHGPVGRIGPPGTDPVERYLRWLLEEASRAIDDGLSGERLRARVRARFEEQRQRPGAIDFLVRLPGFLEVTAAAAERDIRA